MLTGHKTERERFAGAVRTWTCEGMMGDGKALQMGTSHELGQNFARAFGIQFSDAEGAQQYPWQTSWGASTRLIGALIMAHGDDFGLRLPPILAPERGGGAGGPPRARGSSGRPSPWWANWRPAGVRVRLDDRTDTGFGRRSVDWELKGVPVRVEVGPRDLAEGNVTVVTRHRRTKDLVPLAGAVGAVVAVLAGVADDLRAEAGATRQARTVDVDDLDERRRRRGHRVRPAALVGRRASRAKPGWPATRSASAASSVPTVDWPRRATTTPRWWRWSGGPTEGGPSAAPGS